MGMAQPWWYSLPQSGVPSEPFGSAGRLEVPHRAGPRSARGPWQIGHTAGAISAASQEVAVAAQLQGWMLAWGTWGAVRSFPNIFGLTGATAGKGARSSRLVAPRPRRVLLL